jgi:hypothetical protein
MCLDTAGAGRRENGVVDDAVPNIRGKSLVAQITADIARMLTGRR